MKKQAKDWIFAKQLSDRRLLVRNYEELLEFNKKIYNPIKNVQIN